MIAEGITGSSNNGCASYHRWEAEVSEYRDIYSLVQGNLRRLFSLFVLFAFLVLALSGIGIYLLQRFFVPKVDF